MKRKNGRDTKGACLSAEDQGVDLNRNYDISWVALGEDQICESTYPGTAPFSEPETRTMRDFILEHKDTLKFIVNYHAFGNMLPIPYQAENDGHVLTDKQEQIYFEIRDEVVFPADMISGTSKQLLDYYANGEAADWALHETGIIAMSPEIGNESAFSFTYDIPNVQIEANIIMDNLDMPRYLIKKAEAQLDIQPIKKLSPIQID